MENSIIIPCYNEAQRLDSKSFENFLKANQNYSICFVNDGSSDDTLDILESFQRSRENQIYIYDAPYNQGKGEAIRAGMNYMLNTTDARNIGFMDADLATGFEDYKNLVSELEDELQPNSVVIGSRSLEATSNIKRTPFRSLTSKIFNVVIRKIIGIKIEDSQCGAKVFSRESANSLFQKKFISRWLFDVEIFLRMRNQYGKQKMSSIIKEVSLEKWKEIGGSKITILDSIMIPVQLMLIAIFYNIKNTKRFRFDFSSNLVNSMKVVKSFLY